MTESSANKVAVITGASSGIGQATALEFAEQGYNIVLAARRRELLEEVAAQCREFGVEALPIVTDTTDEKAVQKLATKAADYFGGFDVWVNDAAVYMFGKFDETPLDAVRQLLDTNLLGYIYGSRAALTHFKERGQGTLINISSVNAFAPSPYTSIYNASKFAIRGLDDSIRMELILDKMADTIHVCTVMPASIDTNIFQNAANYTGSQVRALEPVYDPAYVARKIVKLAQKPRRSVIVGPAGKLMAFQHAHSPRLYERMLAKFTDRDMLTHAEAKPTSGNLFQPMEQNTGMYGGWRESRLRADRLTMVAGASLVASLALLGGLLMRHRTSHR